MDLSVNNSHNSKESKANPFSKRQPKQQDVEDTVSEDEDLSSPVSAESDTHVAESEPKVSVRVRDMIRLYDKQATPTKVKPSIKPQQTVVEAECSTSGTHSPSNLKSRSQHTLASVKSSYCGLNRFGSQNNVKQYVAQLEEQATTESPAKFDTKSLGRGSISPRERDNCDWSKDEVNIVQLQEDHDVNLEENSVQCTKIYRCDHVQQVSDTGSSNEEETKRLEESTEILDESEAKKTMRHTYESKTTISKTQTGVRIVIDIYFNSDDEMDESQVSGSRIETSIPGSSILAEFQEKALQYLE